MTTPTESGYVMPAEWREHRRCWMAWPTRAALWGGRIEAARAAYGEVARTIARFEPVTMVVPPAEAAQAHAVLGPEIDILCAPIDDSWIRDSGPTFVIDGNGGLAGVDWRFNGWGGKYRPHDKDAAVAEIILKTEDIPRFAAPLILEGGSIAVDGEGTVLTTRECLLNPNRNPDLDQDEIARHLKDYLGVRKVIWLDHGVFNDETDGHVDNLACFHAPGKVLICTCDPDDGENYDRLSRNIDTLSRETDAQGRPLEITPVPLPTPMFGDDEQRLAASYINFYVANGAVIMPGFGCPEDAKARAIIAAAFPEREVIQLCAAALTILHGGGNIHCITQQQPVP
ncbi:agmatine deiminase family protein [Varunaivibrio sulfuroxidans]|uniref:Putative agmatine deiminase n=1 Tax=Varunaivibrio sulfuroxidans TaxID=1773489 RepID=A0A4R3JCL1_9PROT|nr:agmatine deiminase family protein [Varunaivibrio sulfuroxidans]TCS63407.1 agmatine deiminase [Varunaivibrio sulfuroxidans]WES30447.1 agmatine deiminase family protein [Varunaivibrio sulfuroxidans]